MHTDPLQWECTVPICNPTIDSIMILDLGFPLTKFKVHQQILNFLQRGSFSSSSIMSSRNALQLLLHRHISNQSPPRSRSDTSIHHMNTTSCSFRDLSLCRFSSDLPIARRLDTHCECTTPSIIIPGSCCPEGQSNFVFLVWIWRNVKRPTIERFSIFCKLHIIQEHPQISLQSPYYLSRCLKVCFVSFQILHQLSAGNVHHKQTKTSWDNSGQFQKLLLI